MRFELGKRRSLQAAEWNHQQPRARQLWQTSRQQVPREHPATSRQSAHCHFFGFSIEKEHNRDHAKEAVTTLRQEAGSSLGITIWVRLPQGASIKLGAPPALVRGRPLATGACDQQHADAGPGYGPSREAHEG